MTRDEQFFYDNAGYSVAANESQEQGHERCARALAAAEQYAREHNWVFEWDYDQDGCNGCDCGANDCACANGEPHETLRCILFEPYTCGLASLGGICGATPEYRRVIEAELALEAMPKEATV